MSAGVMATVSILNVCAVWVWAQFEWSSVRFQFSRFLIPCRPNVKRHGGFNPSPVPATFPCPVPQVVRETKGIRLQKLEEMWMACSKQQPTWVVCNLTTPTVYRVGVSILTLIHWPCLSLVASSKYRDSCSWSHFIGNGRLLQRTGSDPPFTSGYRLIISVS